MNESLDVLNNKVDKFVDNQDVSLNLCIESFNLEELEEAANEPIFNDAELNCYNYSSDDSDSSTTDQAEEPSPETNISFSEDIKSTTTNNFDNSSIHHAEPPLPKANISFAEDLKSTSINDSCKHESSFASESNLPTDCNSNSEKSNTDTSHNNNTETVVHDTSCSSVKDNLTSTFNGSKHALTPSIIKSDTSNRFTPCGMKFTPSLTKIQEQSNTYSMLKLQKTMQTPIIGTNNHLFLKNYKTCSRIKDIGSTINSDRPTTKTFNRQLSLFPVSGYEKRLLQAENKIPLIAEKDTKCYQTPKVQYTVSKNLFKSGGIQKPQRLPLKSLSDDGCEEDKTIPRKSQEKPCKDNVSADKELQCKSKLSFGNTLHNDGKKVDLSDNKEPHNISEICHNNHDNNKTRSDFTREECQNNDISNKHSEPIKLRVSIDKELQQFDEVIVNNEKYIVLNELGKGGSSVVYFCYNPVNKMQSAVKRVRLKGDKACVEGYINEVKLLHKLQNCDKIIKMYSYEILKTDGILYMVLEKGDGDLSTILKDLKVKGTRLPLYKLIYYWMEMLYAVKQIHESGIIHSDLKPANFLAVHGDLKLIDFGIASAVQTDMTSVVKNVQIGSFNYISPEALHNNSRDTGKAEFKISFKSDVWSLGCILYQFVYGKTPFQHIGHMYAKLSAILDPNQKISYPEASWVPQKIITTIKDCLKYDMKSRPSVNELIEQYENFFEH